MGSIDGKIAIVTGAARGIGQKIALKLAAEGAKIAAIDLKSEWCDETVAGVTAELIKVLVKLLLKGTTTAFVGDFANFAVGCSFVLPASLVYHAKPGKKSALAGLIVGTLCMTVFGSRGFFCPTPYSLLPTTYFERSTAFNGQ